MTQDIREQVLDEYKEGEHHFSAKDLSNADLSGLARRGQVCGQNHAIYEPTQMWFGLRYFRRERLKRCESKLDDP